MLQSKRQRPASPNTSYRITSQSEIKALLEKLLVNHTLLSIRLDNRSRTFGSMILEVNNQQNYLVLDEFYPRNEITESLTGNHLLIETKLNGVDIRFKTFVTAVAEKDNTEYYKVSYPTYVHHHQRRATYRANVGVSDSIPLALSTTDNVLMHAELCDISLGGIHARIKSPMFDKLSVGSELPTCIIQGHNGKKIVSSLEVVRIEQNQAPRLPRMSAKFTRIAPRDKHELARLIATLDRENIKRLKRLSSAG